MSMNLVIMALIFGHMIDTFTMFITLSMLIIYINPELPSGLSVKQYLLNQAAILSIFLTTKYQNYIQVKND